MEQLNTVVIPAKAGIHCVLLNFETGWSAMDPGLRRGDGFMSYCNKLLFIKAKRSEPVGSRPPRTLPIFMRGIKTPLQWRGIFWWRLVGLYNSHTKSVQSLGLLVILLGPFHFAGVAFRTDGSRPNRTLPIFMRGIKTPLQWRGIFWWPWSDCIIPIQNQSNRWGSW